MSPSQTNSKRILRSLKFQHSIIIEPINHCGGIWVCWNSNNLTMINHDVHTRCVHLRVLYKPLNKHLLVTGAYFPAKEEEKQTFWDYIQSFHLNIDIPWLLIGDFNELLSSEDKVGGNPPTRNQCSRLPALLNSLHATDIPCLQQAFSWKMNTEAVTIYERLDRAIGNNYLMDTFERASITYGNFTVSDHAPDIFLSGENLVSSSIFRFQNYWTLEKESHDIVRKQWNTSIRGSRFFRITTKLSRIKNLLKTWAKGKYGNNKTKLHAKEAKIAELESKLIDQPFNPRLNNHLQRMIKQRERLLLFNQKNWGNLARKNWLTQGDRNSRFFHNKMKTRNARNTIYRLKNDLGQWEDDPVQISRSLISSFQHRFTTGISNQRTINLDFINPIISDAQSNALTSPVSDEEVQNAFFHMDPFKAPGSDGFGPKFYQAYWKIIGKEVTTAVKSFFSHGCIPPNLNHTLVALIPKVQLP